MCKQAYAESGFLLQITPCAEYSKLLLEKEELQKKYRKLLDDHMDAQCLIGEMVREKGE